MPRTMPKRCPPWWKQTCQEHLAQATCRAKACRAYTVRRTSQAPHTASARGHAQLSGVALVPHYPPCFHAPRAAPAKHLTLPAHIVMLGPHAKRKDDGAEPGFEPGSLRLVAVRSNHWAKLALMPWDNMANSGRKLVTMARPVQKIASSRAVCRVLSVFFFRWVRYTLAEKAEPAMGAWQTGRKSKSAKECVVAQADWFRSRSW